MVIYLSIEIRSYGFQVARSMFSGSFRLCLRVWRGGEGKALRGGKYEGKWRNLSKNLKE